MFDYIEYGIWGLLSLYVAYKFIRSIRIVPTRKSFIVERLGRYSNSLTPGFHALVPFFDKVTFVIDLKEEAIEVPPQMCFTLDNVRVEVDGVIYMSVLNPEKAAYGVTDFRFAAIQLAQTTMRAIVGTIDLDKTFEERDLINSKIVEVLSEVEEPWGIKVHRYEVKNIVPPISVQDAMEKQMTAERDRRAQIATSEGDRQSRINNSEGYKAELVNKSQGEKQKRINEAEGKAAEISSIALATASAIEKIGGVIKDQAGATAFELQMSEKYIKQLNHVANSKTEILLPADLTQVSQLLESIGLTSLSKKKR